MAYAITTKQFGSKIASIKGARSKLRTEVQDALIAATYLCLANSGGTTPFQQILDAVGTTAHRQGITKWAETFAPVKLEGGKLVLNKAAWKNLDVAAHLADFDAFIVESGMAETLWDEIAADENKTVSIFDAGKYLSNVVSKLDKEGMSLLAAEVAKAVETYNQLMAKIEATSVENV